MLPNTVKHEKLSLHKVFHQTNGTLLKRLKANVGAKSVYSFLFYDTIMCTEIKRATNTYLNPT